MEGRGVGGLRVGVRVCVEVSDVEMMGGDLGNNKREESKKQLPSPLLSLLLL